MSVVISTHCRPGPLREAIAAIRAQDADVVIETIAVFDKEEPDRSLESSDARRPVRVAANHRAPGLPGSRNAGVELAAAPVIGFCDDDDLWAPAKARLQLALMERTGAPTVGCAIEVVTPARTIDRPATGSAVRLEELVRRRIPEAYMGTVLVRREAFESIGLVAEDIPGGFGEDYDWWLRAARYAPIPLVSEPLFQLRWGGQSYFRDRWRDMSEALAYLIEHHPELNESRAGLARIEAQRAFAEAAQGHRREAWGLLAGAARRNPLEPRLAFAALVALGVPADRVMAALNRGGRGI